MYKQLWEIKCILSTQTQQSKHQETADTWISSSIIYFHAISLCAQTTDPHYGKPSLLTHINTQPSEHNTSLDTVTHHHLQCDQFMCINVYVYSKKGTRPTPIVMPRQRSLERPSGNAVIPSFCKTKSIKPTQKAVGKNTTHCMKVRKNSTITNKKRKTISGDISLNKKPFSKADEMHEPDEMTPPDTTSTSTMITTTSTVTSVTASTPMTTNTEVINPIHSPTPTPIFSANPSPLPNPNPLLSIPHPLSLQISDEDRLFSRLEKRLEDKLSSSLKIGFQEYDHSFCTAVDKMTSAVNELIKSNQDKMTSAVNELIKSNQALAAQHMNIGSLEIENKKLNNKIHKLEMEQNKLKKKNR